MPVEDLRSVASSVLAPVRLPGRVRAGFSVINLPQPDWVWETLSRFQALPAPAHGASTHAQGSLTPWAGTHLAYRYAPCCLPHNCTRSTHQRFDFGALYLAYATPHQRFAAALTRSRRMIRGHSGSLRLTMWWTFTTSSMPVYAGAFAIPNMNY